MIRKSRIGHLAVLAAVSGIAALAGCNSQNKPTGGTSSTGGSASNGGSTGGSSAGSTGGVTATQACTDYSNAECALYNSCSDGYFISTEFGDLATCASAYLAYCNYRLAAPASALTANQLEQCAQALPSETCVNLYGGDSTSPCNAPTGPAANGSACSISGECASTFCQLPKDQVCGTCQPVPVSGASCASPDTQCGPGLICLSTTQTCGTAVPDGGTCASDDDCLFGFSCLDADGGLDICQPGGLAGASCDYHNRTGPPCFSRAGFFCEKVGDGGTCTARAFAAGGDECGTISGVDTVCEASGTCQKSQPDAGTGICEAAAADGAACDSVLGPPCPDLSRCVPTSDTGTAGICTADSSETCSAVNTNGGSSGGTTGSGSTGGGTTSGGSSGGSTGATLNTIALIDNDGYVNDGNNDDTPLPLWQGLMTGAGLTAYDLITVDSSGDQSSTPNTVPSAAQLAQYTTVIWFTADNNTATGVGQDSPMSADQQGNLTSWLDLGGRTLVVFSEYLVGDYYGTSGEAWTTAVSIPLFNSYIPLQGAETDPYQWSATNGDGDLGESNFMLSGTSTVSAAFAALTWADTEATTDDTVAVLNPATGTDTLATVQSDPLETNTMNITTALAVGKKLTGALKTSTAVYVGFPLEDIVPSGAATQQAFFNGVVQTYAGVP